ncbi:MAG: GTPase HflX [Verrucomicrobia bacterium]|nr:GTPase HflX [Verrucomicrobiota bacterium]MBV8378090.1 GTPase HflX [Verrucomicrobiota bacterium]
MFNIKEEPRQIERALLVAVYQGADQRDECESLLAELDSLVDTLAIRVIDRLVVKVSDRTPRYFVGSGKAEEISQRAKELEIDVIVFDNGLSPAQQRNWEALTGIAVIDREEVILDIFARRAQTKEARLQVDLARMEYSLPRLTRAWGHLSRQGGGLGGKGEGETQLEADRRLVRAQIDCLKSDLELVRLRRATQRKQRQRLPLPSAAIVGYTNVGKSALLKKLTGAQVLVEDKLFATLDTTTRRVILPTGQSLLLTDTVGFVRSLPHRLVEAFKATLEEAVLSEFLIHVLDASHPRVFELYQTTMRVLGELGADAKRMITVLNKVDLVKDESTLHTLRLHFPDGVFVSVRSGEGLRELLHRMGDLLADRVSRVELALPLDRTDLLSLLHRTGLVIDVEYEESHVSVVALVSPKVYARVERYLVRRDQELQTA